MVAEALAQSGAMATREDIARLGAATKADIAELKSYIDSRLHRYTAIILIPVALTMLGTVGALIALVAQL